MERSITSLGVEGVERGGGKRPGRDWTPEAAGPSIVCANGTMRPTDGNF